MFGPFAGEGVGFFLREMSVFEQIRLDNIVAVGRLAARVQHAKHVVTPVPIFDDHFHEHHLVANGVG